MHIDNDREENKIESQTKMITSLHNVISNCLDTIVVFYIVSNFDA